LTIGPCPDSAQKWPKISSHVGHSVAHHLFGKLSLRAPRVWCVSTMHEWASAMADACPCASLDVGSTRALAELYSEPLHSPSPASPSLLARAHATMVVAAIAEPAKLHATASLSLSVLNSSHHHLRHAMPRAQRSFPGLDRRRRPLPPGRHRRRRLLSWPRHHRPPWAELGAPTRTRRPLGARAALATAAGNPLARDRPHLPCLAVERKKKTSISCLCVSLFE
jgi:hypothetical protein